MAQAKQNSDNIHQFNIISTNNTNPIVIDQNSAFCDSKQSNPDSTTDDEIKSNHNDDESSWSCSRCTYYNEHDGIFCEMCDESRLTFDDVRQNAWNRILSSNHSSLNVPQWIQCTKCNVWRTIKVPISTIKSWKPPSVWYCDANQCGTQQRTPSVATHSPFEILALSVQRQLALLREDGLKPDTKANLDKLIAEKTHKINQASQPKQALLRNDTIIIEDDEENEEKPSETEDDNTNQSWICETCTFNNDHLGNLCAMCDAPRIGSKRSMMSDEDFAKKLQASFDENDTAMSVSPDLSASQRRNNLKNQLPPNAEIGPFGAITCVVGGRRVYLARNEVDKKLKWSTSAPDAPQSWVREVFPDANKLPKMNKTLRAQIEQRNGMGHYYDAPTNLIHSFKGKIDLTTDDDVQVLDKGGKNDEEYARKLQQLFNNESNDNVVKHNGYVDFEAMNDKRKGGGAFGHVDEDIMPFDFAYPGMHADAEEVSIQHIQQNGAAGPVDGAEEDLGRYMNQALRQNDVVAIDDVKGLSIQLFDHQKRGVAWMLEMEESRNNGGFLCDQMGVGKTIQIIALMLRSRQDMIDEAKKKYKEDGYVSVDSDGGDSVDSNDETCGGFVVKDDVIDFRSDQEEEDDDDDWVPAMDYDDEDKKNKKKKRGKKRKFSDIEDDDDFGKENVDNSNNSNNKESDAVDGVSAFLVRLKSKNKKKRGINEYFNNEPVNKRRKLNHNKSRKPAVNDSFAEWHRRNFGDNKSKPWLALKQRTLIIGPLAILDQWAEEIGNRAPGQFNVAVYYGANRKKKYNKYNLKKFDAVITTYGHISSEYANGNEEKQSGLFKLPNGFFHRVVLDEAHTIKNPSSQQSKACAQIGNRGCKARWCLTGTPIQNKLLDLFPLSRFLQVSKCGTAKDFKQTLRLSNSNKTSVSGRTKMIVTAFLGAHMLRRLKSEVVDDLVSKTEEVIELEFDEAEDDVYKAFQNHARSRFNRFVRAGTAKKNYAHILVLLLRLRQICDHPYLAMKLQDGASESVGDGEDSDGNEMKDDGTDPVEKVSDQVLKRLNERDDSILDSECPICLDIFNDGIMFPKCGHLICKEHLYDLEEKCPECRGAFKVNRVLSFRIIIKSPLVDEKHKKSLLADGSEGGLVMNSQNIVERMAASPLKLSKTQRRVVWRKVSKAKGAFRSEDQIEEEMNERLNNNKKEETKEEKLQKMQKTFDYDTFAVDEKYNALFPDDDENGYEECDKYPNEDGWQFIPSSKTKMMMQKIQQIQRDSPNDKIIVFSQFTTMLSVLERVLRKHNINYLMYDGSKTRQQRKDIIKSFKDDAQYNDIPVMLMSLKCAALGLNLTVANHVIFCDLWWNPAIESQAIDRVHRIGQKKQVFVTRMIIKTSVEERILALQRDKQRIADSALDGANFVKKNGLNIQDLAKLFGSNQEITRLAARNDGGFSRDSLMNVRRNHQQQFHHQQNHHQHNHHHQNNNNHNHNHPYINHDYLATLSPETRAILLRAQQHP